MAVQETILKIKVVGTKEQEKQLGSLDLRLKNLRAENKKLNKSQDLLQKKNETGTAAFKKITQAIGKNQTTMLALRGAKTKIIAKIKDETRSVQAATGSYNALTAENRILSQRLKQLSDPLGKNKKQFDRLSKSIRTNEERLKRMDAAMGRQQRNVGNYSGALRSASASLIKIAAAVSGAIIVVRSLSRIFGSAFKTISNFQQANADLASVLGKTRSEIKALSEDAKRLGASTAFTATEVAKLQKEFAKLGFFGARNIGRYRGHFEPCSSY